MGDVGARSIVAASIREQETGSIYRSESNRVFHQSIFPAHGITLTWQQNPGICAAAKINALRVAYTHIDREIEARNEWTLKESETEEKKIDGGCVSHVWVRRQRTL